MTVNNRSEKKDHDYEHAAGCIRMALKIRRKYLHVALMTASLLSTILKTTRTQPTLLVTCDLLIVMKKINQSGELFHA